MVFGKLGLEEALGAVLAHRVVVALPNGKRVLAKGTPLTQETLALLEAGAITHVWAAKLEQNDVGEDAAAHALALALAAEGVAISRAALGRVNFFAKTGGLFCIDPMALFGFNGFDAAITLATLAPYARVKAGEMLATLKIIPYGVAGGVLQQAASLARESALHVAPWKQLSIGAISTHNGSLKDSVLDKTITTLDARIKDTQARVICHETCRHEPEHVAGLLARMCASCEVILIYGSSACSDARDCVPAAIVHAGGTLVHFGMPVDPGNLLVLGTLQGRTIIGAPGCARSPKRNGFDLVLERVLCGLNVGPRAIAAMGLGGLLQDISVRPVPRAKLGEPMEE